MHNETERYRDTTHGLKVHTITKESKMLAERSRM